MAPASPSPGAETPARARPPRTRLAIGASLALVLLLLAVALVLQPRPATGLLLRGVGRALGLDISASGANDYRLRGTPTLLLRDLVVRERGAPTPLLRAKRLYVSLPWATLRARGALLDATRLELDAPVLDLAALRHWLATRPPTVEKRMPNLASGLRVRNGTLLGPGWRLDDIAIDAPRLMATEPLHARLRGRLRAPPMSVPMDLAVALEEPGALLHSRASGFAVSGSVAVEHARDWRLPAQLTVSGPLRIDGALAIVPARIGVAARYQNGATTLPLTAGLYGPLRIEQAATLAPAFVVVRGMRNGGNDLVPRLQGQAVLAWEQRLILRLRGELAAWPGAWPALPAPLDRSSSPLPFALDYTGAPDFGDLAHLRLARDATRFDARFRLPLVLQWIAADGASPLPPLDGTLSAPRLEIAGASLEGVEATLDDEATRDVR